VYAVVVGKNGPKLHKAVSVSNIAMFVENWSDRPVVDKTGIQGLFEVETDGRAPLRPRPVAPGAEPPAEDIAMADPTRQTLFLIFEWLGLKIEPQRAPVDVIVIDHVEKPSEN
jgi:bla regulator protein blaR1